MTPADLWSFLLPGYLTTIAIETPILLIGLSRTHSILRRIGSGIWLTACTYPMVVLILPILLKADESDARYYTYLTIAEIFAPVVECVLFAMAFHRGNVPRRDRIRDFAAITLANLTSFGIGLLIDKYT